MLDRYGVTNISQNEEVKQKKISIARERANRDCVKIYNSLCKKYKIKQKRGFYLKTETEIMNEVDRINSEHNLI